MKTLLTTIAFIATICCSAQNIRTKPHDTTTQTSPVLNPQFAGGQVIRTYKLSNPKYDHWYDRYFGIAPKSYDTTVLSYRYSIVHDSIVPKALTKWSVMVAAQANNPATVALADQYGTKAVRWKILYSDYKDEAEMHVPLLDAYVAAGYRLILNINKSLPVEGKPTSWVKDLPRWRRFVRAVLAAYGKSTDLLVTENEEFNQQYHSEDIYHGYIDELAIAVQEGHAAGVKVSNGGWFMITELQSTWPFYNGYKAAVLAIKNTGIDFFNVHDKHPLTVRTGSVLQPVTLAGKISYLASLVNMTFTNNEAGTTGDLNILKAEYINAGFAFVTYYSIDKFYISPEAFTKCFFNK